MDQHSSKSRSTKGERQGPEFIVSREFFDQYFERPLPQSSFHDLVNKGQIIPWPQMRGRFLANESLRRLKLPKISKLPDYERVRSLEDIVRFGFTLIDHTLFPAPPWLLAEEMIDIQEGDHARRISEQYRDAVEALDSAQLKLAYFAGVLDAVFKGEADLRDSSSLKLIGKRGG